MRIRITSRVHVGGKLGTERRASPPSYEMVLNFPSGVCFSSKYNFVNVKLKV